MFLCFLCCHLFFFFVRDLGRCSLFFYLHWCLYFLLFFIRYYCSCPLCFVCVLCSSVGFVLIVFDIVFRFFNCYLIFIIVLVFALCVC